MNNTQRLHDLGQSIWLDNISRRILDDGTLRRYIDEFSVTGLTSNPTIFDEAIGAGDTYDDGIRTKAAAGKSGEALFVELALEDLRRAADLFKPIFDATHRVDGWVSMELSPLLADDTAGSIEAAAQIYQQAEPRQSVRQDSRYACGRTGDRGIDLRRCTDQRHVAVFARAISGVSRGLPARDRATVGRRTRCRESARWRRYSSAAGIGQSATRCRHRCATALASQ